MLIGLIADTHLPFAGQFLWDEIASKLQGVELILHAGDIVHPAVLDRLETIAPVMAARGNNDAGIADSRISDHQILELHGRRLVVMHDMEPENRPIGELRRQYLQGQAADIIVTGHTHFERMDFREGVLQVNPGSATLPHLMSMRLGTIGLLDWHSDGPHVRIVRLGESEGRPNPGIEYLYAPTTGVSRLG
jgi:putative phosphoesterase